MTFNSETLLIHLVNLPQKAFSIGLRICFPVSLLLVVTKAGGNYCKLSFKAPEEDEEELQEGTASLVADKEINVGATVVAVLSQ